MRGRKLWAGVGIACAFALVATLGFAATAKEAPEKVTIDDCTAKQAPVEMSHAKHVAAGIACGKCHHNQPDLKAGTDEKVETCASCHVKPEKAETPKCSEMGMTKNPFHISCIGCHKAEVAKNAAVKAPTKCAECHPKKGA